MNKKLYLESGYLNFEYIFKMSEKHNAPYIFIIGGRGIGKTYGALKYLLDNEIKFMFMRRTQSQLDTIKKDELSPFKKLNADTGRNISFFPISKYNSSINNAIQNENGKLIPDGDYLGMACALSTISNLRGFDASDIDVLLYDEFIPERHEKTLKNESDALFNSLETIGRNRELNGYRPLKLLALANSNNLSNEIFISLGLVNIVDKMQKSGNEIKFLDSRNIMLVNIQSSPISGFKLKSTLANLTAGTSFSDMAYHNNYIGVIHDCIRSEDLRQYRIVISLGELQIYKHKSQLKYYVCDHLSGVPKRIYTTSVNSLREFRAKERDIWNNYILNRMSFETYSQQVLFEKYNRLAR